MNHDPTIKKAIERFATNFNFNGMHCMKGWQLVWCQNDNANVDEWMEESCDLHLVYLHKQNVTSLI